MMRKFAAVVGIVIGVMGGIVSLWLTCLGWIFRGGWGTARGLACLWSALPQRLAALSSIAAPGPPPSSYSLEASSAT